MALQHDSEGFLTGDTVRDIKRANNLLKSIRSDIAAIKRAVMAQESREASQSRRATPPAAGNRSRPRFTPVNANERPPRAPRTEQTRTGQTERTRSDNAATPNQAANASNRTASPRSRNEQGEVTPQAGANRGQRQPPATPNRERARDASGRFMADESATGERSAEPNARRDNRGRFTSNGEGDEQSQRTLLNGLADRIATAVTDSSAGLEEVDPTVRAFNEVAEPLARGYQALFSGEKDDTRWYRRIFGELRLFRKEDSVFNRAARRSLRNIEERPPVVDDDGGRSFFGGLLGSILPWLLGAIAGFGPMLLTGIKTVFGGFGLILRTVLAGIFSPIGLAITVAATAAWGLFTDEGRKFFADLGSRISEAWDGAVDWFKETFPGITEKFSKVAETIADLWQPIADFFKDKFGIVQKGVDVIKDGASKTVERVKSSYTKTAETLSEAKSWTVDKVTRVKDWVLGQTSRFFESGNSGAGTVSTGKGDHGGVSYGTYQLSSKQGTLQEFLKSTPFGKQFEGLIPGTREFNKKWKSVAKSEPDFEAAQHDFIQKTHFEPQLEKLRKAGMDLSDRGSAVKDAVWSTSVQFGGNTSLIEKALQGKDVAKLSDADIIKAIQDYKIDNNEGLFESSSAKTRAGTLSRAEAEKEKLLSLAALEASLPATVTHSGQFIGNSPIRTGEPSLRALATASAPSPSVTAIPRPPIIAEAPPLKVPMASDTGKRPVNVTVDRGDVQQNLSDRTIAHIQLGGLGGV
jgi:hypothetical protein